MRDAPGLVSEEEGFGIESKAFALGFMEGNPRTEV